MPERQHLRSFETLSNRITLRKSVIYESFKVSSKQSTSFFSYDIKRIVQPSKTRGALHE